MALCISDQRYDGASKQSDLLNAAGRVLVGLTEAEVKLVHRWIRTYVKRHASLRRAQQTGNGARVRALSYRIEASFGCRFCALVAAVWRPKKGVKQKQFTFSAAEKLTREVSLRSPTTEAVTVRRVEKPEGGERLVVDFGIRSRAGRYLITDILQSRLGISRFKFARRGGGRDAAIRWHLNKVKHGGVRAFTLLDIANCYPSVDPAALPTLLRLPKAIVDGVIAIPAYFPLTFLGVAPTSESAVRSGIPQGSRPSAFIVSKLLEEILSATTASAVTTHGDDILLGWKAMDHATEAKDALALALATHPAGPLLMKTAAALPLGKKFDYCGYWIRRRWKFFGGYARATPSDKAFLRNRRRAATELAFTPNSGHIDQIALRASRWVSAFGAWDAPINAKLTLVEVDLHGDPLETAWSFRKAMAKVGLKVVKGGEAESIWREAWLPGIGLK